MQNILLTFYVLIEFEMSTFVLKCHILCVNKEIQTNREGRLLPLVNCDIICERCEQMSVVAATQQNINVRLSYVLLATCLS